MRTTTTTSAIADSVAALLKQARLESGLSRASVAVRSKIPERYIALFEEDVNGQMPEDVYAKIYLKAYGKFLGFDANTLVDLYKKEKARTAPAPERRAPTRSSSSSSVRRHPTKSIPTSQMVVTPKIIQSAMLGLAVLGFAVYFGVQIKKIIAPPEITLASPQDGLVTEERSLIVEGRTDSEVLLQINGKQISPDADGKFKDTLDLQEGLNIITVTGAKKHSKEMSVTRRIIVMPKERAAVVAPTDATVADTETGATTEAAAPIVPARKKTVKPAAPVTIPAPEATAPAATSTPTPTSTESTPAATETPTPAPSASTQPATTPAEAAQPSL